MEQISKTSADIVFSGHTHNGQLFPINLITHCVYELSHGYMKKRSTHFFVSSGIRLWGPPVRTTGKSEILVVDVILLPIPPLTPPQLITH
jgi:predicted MPP superfamily phosphohydrolase